MNTFIITRKIFNKLMKELKIMQDRGIEDDMPSVFMLGGRNNKIDTIIEIKGYAYEDEYGHLRGCEEMASIKRKEMSRVCIEVFKHKRIPYGIARIHYMSFDNAESSSCVVGPVLYQMGRMGGFLLTLDTNGIYIQQAYDDCTVRKIQYTIK